LSSVLSERLALAGQVWQLESRRFIAQRQTCQPIALVEFQGVKAFLQLLEPQEQPSILPQQLPAQPATDQEGEPS